MKKIITAFDGTQFPEGAFEFARRLNEREPIELVGVLLPEVSYGNIWSYSSGMAGPVYVPSISTKETGVIRKNIQRFELQCRRENIKHSIHQGCQDHAI